MTQIELDERGFRYIKISSDSVSTNKELLVYITSPGWKSPFPHVIKIGDEYISFSHEGLKEFIQALAEMF